eukprot:TRINITY_DN11810_c0_g1_i1.p1 TRINITY_DN11810_c0_g1~~TRINITY_DN11810_c0_g1_i1.p1  ORF type:complete len:500 (-),score=116.16 TRINITY_DN11810_c0_g1_i1:68-1567(-)
MSSTFASLGAYPWIANTCSKLGMDTPTPIQEACIPPIIQGKNVIGAAKTGSGKTAAYVLPILHKLSEDPYGIYAIILVPTRELALQISEQVRVLGATIKVKDLVIIGGGDIVDQATQLKERPHIVVATPGRLAYLLKNASKDTLGLNFLKFLVLDEADRLLEKEYTYELQAILEELPPPSSRQTLLFSATMTPNIEKISNTIALTNPYIYRLAEEHDTVDLLRQEYVFMPVAVKECYLLYVIRAFLQKDKHSQAIIFSSTCKSVDVLTYFFNEFGVSVAPLHSNMQQKYRTKSINSFRNGFKRVLIATDVASRGLDIQKVELVLNYNIPKDPKDYVHRVGRTARAGMGGLALTFVTQFDVSLLHEVEAAIKKELTLYDLKEDDVMKGLQESKSALLLAEKKVQEEDEEEKGKWRKHKHENQSKDYLVSKKSKRETQTVDEDQSDKEQKNEKQSASKKQSTSTKKKPKIEVQSNQNEEEEEDEVLLFSSAKKHQNKGKVK